MNKGLNNNKYTSTTIEQRKRELEVKLQEETAFIKNQLNLLFNSEKPKNNSEKVAKYSKMGYKTISGLLFAWKLYRGFRGKGSKKKKTKKWFSFFGKK